MAVVASGCLDGDAETPEEDPIEEPEQDPIEEPGDDDLDDGLEDDLDQDPLEPDDGELP